MSDFGEYTEEGSNLKGVISTAFGDVVDGESVTVGMLVTNIGDFIIAVDDITLTGDSDFTISHTSTPFNVSFDAAFIITVTFNPSGAGAKSGTITIDHDGLNFPRVLRLSGTGVASGVVCVNADPGGFDFSETKVGDSTLETIFTIKNSGDVNLTVTAINFTAEFVAGPTQPSFPFVLAGGASDTFGIIFSPIAEGERTGTVSIVSNAALGNFAVEVTGTAFLVTSAFSITGGSEVLMTALVLVSVATVKQLDAADFNNNAVSSFAREHHFGRINFEKLLTDIIFHYIDRGVVIVTWTVSANGVSTSVNVTIGTVGADGIKKQAVATGFLIEGEIIKIAFSRAASAGVVEIIDYVPKYQMWENQLGSASISLSITPVHSITGDEQVMLAFGDLTVKQLDPDNFDHATTANFKRKQVFTFTNSQQVGQVPVSQGVSPAYGFEKLVMRVIFHYIDLGVATVKVTGTSVRDTVNQDVSIGTVGADEKIKVGIADLSIVDEYIDIEFSRLANGGPLSIIDYTTRYERKGEVQK
jgi:hypothetical protein